MGCFGWHLRLHRATEFEAVFKDRTHRPIQTSLFTVYCCDNNCGHPRLGLAISRRSVKRAVGRNRIKRNARETFRQHYNRLPAMDFVVTCTKKKDIKTSKSQSQSPMVPADIRFQLVQIWSQVLNQQESHRG